MIDNAPNAQAAAQMVLMQTDWTQLSDCNLTSDCVAAFATYRSAVRVIRRDTDAINRSPADYTWPSVPTEDWA
jgi:hypothetical protein